MLNPRSAVSAGRAGALIALAVCLGGEARALDVVRLRNGRALKGEVKQETGKYVTLKYEGGLLRIDRTDILTVERNRPLAEWEVEMRASARREAEALARKVLEELEASRSQQAGAGGAEEAQAKETERLKGLVEDMASADAETRARARRTIEREGRKAVPVLTEALAHRSSFARTAAAQMLRALRPRESVRDMIVALRSAVPDSVKVRGWQRAFVRALRDGLRGVTGRNFGLNPRGAGEDKAVAKWVEWWDGKPTPDGPGAVPRGACAGWDTKQLGEAELDEDDPEYAKKIWEVRRAGDKRYSYAAPAGYGTAAPEQ